MECDPGEVMAMNDNGAPHDSILSRQQIIMRSNSDLRYGNTKHIENDCNLLKVLVKSFVFYVEQFLTNISSLKDIFPFLTVKPGTTRDFSYISES